MRIGYDDLRLNELTVIYPGTQQYSLSEKIQVMNIADYMQSTSDTLHGSVIRYINPTDPVADDEWKATG